MSKFFFLVWSSFLILPSNLHAQEFPKINNLRSTQLFAKFESASFLDDLEIVDSQRKRIKEIQAELKEQFRTIPKSEPGTNTRLKAMEASTTKSFNEIFGDVLLPHQQVRFVQLVHQSEISKIGGSLSRYIVGKHIGASIGITNRQIKDLKILRTKKVEEIRAAAIEFRNQVGAILAEEEKETMALLNDKERRKVTELIGEKNSVLHPGSEAGFYFDKILWQK